MRFGLSKSWGKVPAACAGHATGGSNCMVKFEVSTHSLIFLCMRQEANYWKFRFSPCWPQKSSNLPLLLFCLTSWFCDHSGFHFSLPHLSFKRNKNDSWSSFSTPCLSVRFERPLLQPDPQSKPLRCGTWKYFASLWLRDWKFLKLIICSWLFLK